MLFSQGPEYSFSAINILPIPDMFIEADEIVEIRIVSKERYTVIGPSGAVVRITDLLIGDGNIDGKDGVDLADVITALKNILFSKGMAPKEIRAASENILKTGRVVLVSKATNSRRKKFHLEESPGVPVEDLEKILKS